MASNTRRTPWLKLIRLRHSLIEGLILAAPLSFGLLRESSQSTVSNKRPEDWRIYRVHLFATSPRIFTLAPPLNGVLHLRPELWRTSV